MSEIYVKKCAKALVKTGRKILNKLQQSKLLFFMLLYILPQYSIHCVEPVFPDFSGGKVIYDITVRNLMDYVVLYTHHCQSTQSFLCHG